MSISSGLAPTARISCQALERVQIASPFVLRSFDPPLDAVAGQAVTGVRRIGKMPVVEAGDHARHSELAELGEGFV